MVSTVSRFKPLRILLLIHEEATPPDSLDDFSDDEIGKALWGAEYDVLNALTEMGHSVKVQGVTDELKTIRVAIEEYKPHIAFNLMEDFGGVSIYDQNVVAYLELLGINYTGCNPRGLVLARDKGLAKSLISYHRIPTPKFFVFRKGKKIKVPAKAPFPLFVKSTTEEASFGISRSSIVNTERELISRISFIHESVQTNAIAEPFIPGRELYVGMLGNHSVTTFPVWELKFKKLPEGMPRIATPKVKFDPKYRRKYGIDSGPATGLSQDTIERMYKICRKAFRVLRLNGYARMDFRLSNDGKIYFLEANPNPHVGIDEDLAQSAMKSKMSYEALLQKIINLGLRWDSSTFA